MHAIIVFLYVVYRNGAPQYRSSLRLENTVALLATWSSSTLARGAHLIDSAHAYLPTLARLPAKAYAQQTPSSLLLIQKN